MAVTVAVRHEQGNARGRESRQGVGVWLNLGSGCRSGSQSPQARADDTRTGRYGCSGVPLRPGDARGTLAGEPDVLNFTSLRFTSGIQEFINDNNLQIRGFC
jgi:hypothetical protein